TIQITTSGDQWYHISSIENPADLLSRGVYPNILENNNLWWEGPKFLKLNSCDWKFNYKLIDTEIPELRTTALTVQTENCLNIIITKFSKVTRIVRIVAYVVRFIKNSKLPKHSRNYGVLVPDELDNALYSLINVVQKVCFPLEYSCLTKGISLKSSSKILSLNPYLHNNLIRVGGRISNSKQCFDQIHPIILPKNHILTELIIKHEHERLVHAGAQMVLSSLREKYWPILGRQLCKKIIRNCVKCFKAYPKSSNYLMGNWPEMATTSGYHPTLLDKVTERIFVRTTNKEEDHVSPLNWPLGRVVKLYPGQDGVTRVVEIKVRGGVVKRAINRVCVLPIEHYVT
ncbi:hypothetical protein PPYR_05731, partial [Photinus pyralis]